MITLTSLSASTELKDISFCIDPGHGGTDPGAGGVNGLKEAATVLEISKLVKSKLESRGATVQLTRNDNSTMALSARTNLANAMKADRLISIHLNAFNQKANYTLMTVYLTATATSKSTQIASFIAVDIHNEIGLGYASSTFSPAISGVRQENFHMLRESSMPAVLTESSFIDFPAEEVKLRDPKYIEKVAGIIYAGICKHYNIPVTASSQKSELIVTASNKADNKPVAGAAVKLTLKDGSTLDALTDNAGFSKFSDLSAGDIAISVSHNLFVSASKTISITSGKNSTEAFILEAKKLNSIVGIITDSANGVKLANAKCVLSVNGKIIETVLSSATGVYRFSNLVDNEYTVSVELNGYLPAAQSTQVSGGIEKWNSIKIALQPKNKASLSGNITNAITTEGIANVKITLYLGSTSKEIKTTNSSGFYKFENLEAGLYKISCKPAKPYSSKTISKIQIAENEAKIMDAALTDPTMPGSINGYVYRLKSNRKVAVMNEKVEIYQSSKLVTTLQTGWGATAGQFRADDLAPGSYEVKTAGVSKTVKVSAAKEVAANIKVQ